MAKSNKKLQNFRLEPGLINRLKDASGRLYGPTKTQIVERGIELALRELEKKHARQSS